MGRVLGIWLPTLVNAAISSGVAFVVLTNRWTALSGAATSGATALVITPVAWWWLVVRRNPANVGAGVLAGWVVGLSAHVVWAWPVWAHMLRVEKYSHNQGLGGLWVMYLAVLFAVSTAITSVLCALAGSAIVAVERRLIKSPA
jgi:hypothetical protein